ncbi:MAG TPA: hypothetical protein VH500_00990 [Nitrososphaeraceae archaeon]
MRKLTLVNKHENIKYQQTSFKSRAVSALVISIIGDLLDYIAAPVFDIPIAGDVFDVLLTSLLFRITRSKVSTVINTLELIPFIGDLIPTYTLSTIIWIMREWRIAEKEKIKQFTG